MARRPAKNTKKSSVKVDFSGVETRSVLPEGEYITEVTSVKLEESESSGNQYLAWELEVADGKHKGKKLFNNTSLAEQSLWATKGFLESLGVDVEDGEMDLELDEYVGMQVGVVVEHEVYKGKTRSRIVDTYPAEDDGEEKGDEKSSKSKKADVPTEEEVGEMGKKELKALNDELDLEVDMDGSTSAVRRAVIKAMKAGGHFDGGAEEEEKPRGRKGKSQKEEEAEEKPARGRGKVKDEENDEKPPAKGKGKKVTYAADDINGMDDEELGELIEKHDLDVDLDEHKTMKRKRSAVIDALEAAELLAD